MNKVISVNLNGRAYQLEETGYEMLRKYLDEARTLLENNPDKDEIMADFESAIAEKCDETLGAHKNVITTAEIKTVLEKIGPVDASGARDAEKKNARTDAETTVDGASSNAPQKRLYQIRQGAWLTGVCTGLAAYFNVDVAIVRVAFLVLSTITHGFGLLFYILLMIVMPVARTDEELAAARGTKPFNAHDFIEQAKARAAEFRKEFGNRPAAPEVPGRNAGRSEWKKWKKEMRQWKREWRKEWGDRFKDGVRYSWNHSPVVGAGLEFFRFLMGLSIALITVFWLFSIWTLGTTHMIFGQSIGRNQSLWISIVFVSALAYAAMTPFKVMLRNARPWPRKYNWFLDVMQSIFFVFAVYLVIFTGRELFPAIDGLYQTVIGYFTK